MPASSRFFSASSPTFGMSRVISSWPSLVSRAITSNSSIWIEVYTSSRAMRSLMRMRSAEVVAVPGHERTEHVASQRKLAELRRRPVGDDFAGPDPIAHLHQRALVDAGRLVRPHELPQPIDVDALGRCVLVGRPYDNACTIDLIDNAFTPRNDGGAGVARHRFLHAGAHQRGVGLDPSNCWHAACSTPSARGWRRRSPGRG